MKRQDYYPNRIADQIPWLENFRAKLPTYAATLGLSAEAVEIAVAAARFSIYVLSQWLAGVRAFGPASTMAVDEVLGGTGAGTMALPTFTPPTLPDGVVPVPPGTLTRIFDLVREIKADKACTDAMALDLGIVPTGGGAAHPVPGLKAVVIQGSACQCGQLDFTKYSHQGIYAEGRRNGGAWEFLGIDTESPYVDQRPLLNPALPEVREYRARYWDKGTPNGDWTDVVKVTLAP